MLHIAGYLGYKPNHKQAAALSAAANKVNDILDAQVELVYSSPEDPSSTSAPAVTAPALPEALGKGLGDTGVAATTSDRPLTAVRVAGPGEVTQSATRTVVTLATVEACSAQAEVILTAAADRPTEASGARVGHQPQRQLPHMAIVRNYKVSRPGSPWAACDCPQGMQLQICKHVMKVDKMLGNDIKTRAVTHGAGRGDAASRAAGVQPLMTLKQVSHILGVEPSGEELGNVVLPVNMSAREEDQPGESSAQEHGNKQEQQLQHQREELQQHHQEGLQHQQHREGLQQQQRGGLGTELPMRVGSGDLQQQEQEQQCPLLTALQHQRQQQVGGARGGLGTMEQQQQQQPEQQQQSPLFNVLQRQEQVGGTRGGLGVLMGVGNGDLQQQEQEQHLLFAHCITAPAATAGGRGKGRFGDNGAAAAVAIVQCVTAAATTASGRDKGRFGSRGADGSGKW